MKKVFLPFVIVPVLVLGAVTILRAWLEMHSPDSTATRLASASVLSMAWIVCVPALMLRKGVTLWQTLLMGLTFFVGHRLFIGAVYALAWQNKWTVDGTGEPVRYVAQIQENAPDASVLQVFVSNTFLPVGFGLVFLLAIWSITWAIGFRKKRPFTGGASRQSPVDPERALGA